MAKTPFNISIFLVLWDFNKNFIPQNEAYVMENYLEIVLEKLSFKEGDRSTYAFPIKQDFMSKIAYLMFKNNQYYFSKMEFDDFVDKYHKKKGYKVEDTKFDTLFFQKNILCYSGGYIYFNHTSVLEYYLALYAKNNKEFLDYMIKKENRPYFQHEICFYSGLNPDCKELLDELAQTIIGEIYEDIDSIDDLNKIEIVTDFKLNKDEIQQRIFEDRPSQAELDELYDFTIEETEPLKIDKKGKGENFEEQTEDFFALLEMYGNVLKNAELLDNKDKIYHLDNYMCAMNIIMVRLLKITRDIEYITIFDTSESDYFVDVDILNQTQLYDTFQIAYPIAIQHFISENVGTPKLELAIEELMKQKQDKPFEKFMLVFLKCDLGIGNIKNDLRKYIIKEGSLSILKIIEMKIVFYIVMRFWDGDKKREGELMDLLMEINLKLYPEQAETLRKKYNVNKKAIQQKWLNGFKKL